MHYDPQSILKRNFLRSAKTPSLPSSVHTCQTSGYRTFMGFATLKALSRLDFHGRAHSLLCWHPCTLALTCLIPLYTLFSGNIIHSHFSLSLCLLCSFSIDVANIPPVPIKLANLQKLGGVLDISPLVTSSSNWLLTFVNSLTPTGEKRRSKLLDLHLKTHHNLVPIAFQIHFQSLHPTLQFQHKTAHCSPKIFLSLRALILAHSWTPVYPSVSLVTFSLTFKAQIKYQVSLALCAHSYAQRAL